MSNIRNLESSIHFNRVLFVVFRDPRFLCLYRPPVGDIYVQKVPYLSWSTVSTVFVGFWGALLGRDTLIELPSIVALVGSEPLAEISQKKSQLKSVGISIMKRKCVYLDYNGTTPIYKPVLDAMYPYLTEHFGNPSSSHHYGVEPKRAVSALNRASLFHANLVH